VIPETSLVQTEQYGYVASGNSVVITPKSDHSLVITDSTGSSNTTFVLPPGNKNSSDGVGKAPALSLSLKNLTVNLTSGIIPELTIDVTSAGEESEIVLLLPNVSTSLEGFQISLNITQSDVDNVKVFKADSSSESKVELSESEVNSVINVTLKVDPVIPSESPIESPNESPSESSSDDDDSKKSGNGLIIALSVGISVIILINGLIIFFLTRSKSIRKESSSSSLSEQSSSLGI
jgi:hypothetical protein